MGDYLVRTIAKAAGVRAVSCVTTDLVKEAVRRHKTTPTATTALGRAMSVAALSGALLKVQHRIALKYDGDGPLNKLIVESDSYGKVRGYVSQPKVEVERQMGAVDVPAAVGSGELYVVKDVKLKDLVQSLVPLQSSQIDEDFEYYLNQSEQIPSSVQAGVLLDEQGEVLVAGGVLIQAVGDTDGATVWQMAERLEEMPPVAELLRNGQSPEDVLAMLYGDIEYQLLEQRELRFHCGCSWERSAAAIISLGRDEIESLIEEGQAIVDCHFCHERYIFSRDDLQDLLTELSG